MSISMLHFPARFQSVTDQRWTIAPVSTEKLSIATILFQTSSSHRKIVLIMETFPQKGRLTTETHSHFPSLWSTNPRPSFLFRMQIATISLVETNKNQKLCPFEWQHFHVILFVRLHCRDCISKYLRIEKKRKKNSILFVCAKKWQQWFVTLHTIFFIIIVGWALSGHANRINN